MATLLLHDGKSSRRLDDQKAVTPFAGQKVTVVGTLDEATGIITVKTISSAKCATIFEVRGVRAFGALPA